MNSEMTKEPLSNKKRIFMVGMSDHPGGVEAYIKNLTEILKENYEIIMNMPEMYIDGKVWIRPKNRHRYFRYLSFWKRFFTANRFDVIYFNTCDIISIDLLKFAKAANVPIRIIHSHSADTSLKLDFFHKIEENVSKNKVEKYATNLFACSKIAGDWMFGNREYLIIQNGINIRKFSFDQKKREKCRGILGLSTELVIGCIGRLSQPKNPLFTIQIAKAIINRVPSSNVVIIGDGKLRQDVEKVIAENNLGNKVILIGAVDNVHEWLSAIDVVLMPSLFEGLPFVLVEAQASGLPCVVSTAVSEEANIGGLLEYVDLEQSPEYWAEKVINAAKRGRTDVSRKLIEAGYSIEDTAREITDIIEKSYGNI